MAGETKLNIVSGFNDKGVQDAIKSLQNMRSAIGGFTKQLLGGIGAWQAWNSGVSLIRNSVDATRDLERNLAGLQTIFGDATQEMTAFSEAGVQMGMSTAEAAKASTLIGTQLKAAGFAMEENTGLTKQLVSLGADLAATYGYDVTEALTGMTAMFRGEYDPIEKFGVAIKQAQVNAEMASLGLGKLTGQEKLHAQQLVRIKLLLEGTSDAQGAFARQGDTLFVSQQRLAATWTNLQAQLGENLVSPLTSLIQLMQNLVTAVGPAFNDFFIAVSGYFYTAGDSASAMASQLSGLFTQFAAITANVKWIIDFIVFIMSNLGSSIFAGVIAFKILSTVINGLGTIVTAASTIMTGYAARQAAAAAGTTALAGAQKVAEGTTRTLAITLAATPWGAIATVVGLLGAGLFAFGAAAPGISNTGKSLEQLKGELLGLEAEYEATPDLIKKIWAANNNLPADSLVKKISSVKVSMMALNLETARATDKLDIFNLHGAAASILPSAKDANSFDAIMKKYLKSLKSLSSPAVNPAKTVAQKAKDAAAAAKKAFADQVASIKDELNKLHDSIMGAFDITNMGKSGGSIGRNIDKFMVKLRQFAGYIAQLRARGLNENLLSQLAMAGPENGLAAAKAFAGSPQLVAQANAAYGELGMTASAIAGNVVKAQAAPVYNITVSGGVGSGATIGKAVVAAIQQFELQSGPSWRK